MNDENGSDLIGGEPENKKRTAAARMIVAALTVLLLAAAAYALFSTVRNSLFPGNNSIFLSLENTSRRRSGDEYSMELHSPPLFEDRELNADDVSEVVEKCINGVVGVNAEVYSDFAMISSGSGIILDRDGYIVTNEHVISGGDSITVTLSDDRIFSAEVIGGDVFTDIAVIKIEADGLEPAEFGDSEEVKVGETAIAIGNPTGQLMGTVTAGIISALSRNIMINNNLMTLIQTDASINSGNSGGPLLNRYGQVIGINSAKISSANYEGLGFAIPINSVKPIVEEIITQGYVSGRPTAELRVSEISIMASAFYGIPQGLYIKETAKDGNASKAGISAGDVITAVNGKSVTSLSDAIVIRNGLKPSDSIRMTVYRKGRSFDVVFRLSEQNPENNSYNF